MSATVYQSNVGQLMSTILQLIDTNKILRDQLNKISETNEFLNRQGQEDKKSTNNNDSYLAKLDSTGYCLNHGWRVTKVHISFS